MRRQFRVISGLAAVAAVATLGLGSPLDHVVPDSTMHAQNHHAMATMHPSQLAALRGATARFHRLPAALSEGYEAFGGCFASSDGSGAMGYHYVNNALVNDPAIDPLRPELLVYERKPNGQMQLVAVEWITFTRRWHETSADRPVLFGQEFHENPTLLEEPFYLLHAWIWKHNPSGIFANYNPRVRCD